MMASASLFPTVAAAGVKVVGLMKPMEPIVISFEVMMVMKI